MNTHNKHDRIITTILLDHGYLIDRVRHKKHMVIFAHRADGTTGRFVAPGTPGGQRWIKDFERKVRNNGNLGNVGNNI